MNEVENLIKEIDEWITEEEDAHKIIVLLINKFGIPQELRKRK